jgi:hypothetical protein
VLVSKSRSEHPQSGARRISPEPVLAGNSLCPSQEERTMREAEAQIRNSGLIAKPGCDSTTL